MPTPNFAVGDVQYGNNQNNLSGRYQAIHQTGYGTAFNCTNGTAGTTQVPFGLVSLDQIELLEICLFYPAASGAITTPAQFTLWKLAAGTSTPPIALCASLVVVTEASLPINTVRKFSAATFTGATFQTAQVGQDAYSYSILSPGDQVYLLQTVLGVAGTQTAIQFNFTYRERALGPVGPVMTSSGTNTVFT